MQTAGREHMTLFDKFRELQQRREALLANTIVDPFNLPIDRMYSPIEAEVAGRRILLAGTNNYLGLSFEPQCLEAAQKALFDNGTGTTGSRIANGNFSEHRALERALADFYECQHAILFSTGYQANLGVISALAQDNDLLIIDADCHASIYDACKLSQAEVLPFRHNSVESLEKRLRHLGPRAERTLVVVEGMYSMLGDTAPLAEIVALTKSYGCSLMVDEAHSLGVLGNQGRGLCEQDNVLDQVDFIVGTFSKSLVGIGGFCVSRHQDLELLRYVSRPYMFTASSSPAMVASTHAALKILQERPVLRMKLWLNAHRLHAGLLRLGLKLGADPSPIVAVMLESPEEAIEIWNALFERQIYVNLVLPPGAPNGYSLLRCSISAAHSGEQVDQIVNAFARIVRLRSRRLVS
jgi:8-amino-7-oxononanoate synthase